MYCKNKVFQKMYLIGQELGFFKQLTTLFRKCNSVTYFQSVAYGCRSEAINKMV